jgi:hypothetical protein
LEQERCEKLELELRRVQRRAEELESAAVKEKQLGQQKMETEKGMIQELKRDLLTLEGQRDSLIAQVMGIVLSNLETTFMRKLVSFNESKFFDLYKKESIARELYICGKCGVREVLHPTCLQYLVLFKIFVVFSPTFVRSLF